MRRLLLLSILFFGGTGLVCAQQMTDDQVVQYVKDAQAAGKSQKQISTELLQRGVTKEQALRIKGKYESAQASLGDNDNRPEQMRSRNVSAPIDNNPYDVAVMNDADMVTKVEREARSSSVNGGIRIFGHNLFTNRNLSFEPSSNMATPVNYCLGPGDEVVIDVWGVSETRIRQVISPEGNIQVKGLGPVHLNGMTVKEANEFLQHEFSKIYAGMSGSEPNSQIRLTLGDIRTIQINIMGEVTVPGTYTLSAFSSVFHALYRAGGVNNIGSLRDIRVVRAGKTVAQVDVYSFIMQGKMNDDVRLQEGDVIIVNPYKALVQIAGKVKRPMYYEMKPDETVATLLEYAGGFTGDAYKKAVRLIRKSGREHQVYNIDEMDYSVFRIDDGDLVTIDAVLDRFENRIEIRGAVYRAGLYQLDGNVNTVKQLIKKAEGLRGDAFLNRAVIDREREDLTHEVIPVDVRGLMQGTVADIPLQKNDVLYIPSIHDLQEEATVAIHGEVGNPGIYPYLENMTIEDFVLQAGGVLEAASTVRIEVTRRLKDPKGVSYDTAIGQTFMMELKDGLVIGKRDAEFYLQPFDEVYVRRSPSYHKQQNVAVAGEVMFGGSYALLKKNERLSDLVQKAGGITPDAYAKGARLLRRMSDEEIRRRDDMMRLAQNAGGKDSISVKTLALSNVYSVGINLEAALKKPGSDADLVLREGDMLYIPEYISTVKIHGAVMYPNTVSYVRGEDMRYYINQAGGYSTRAQKSRAYVIYLNGTVSRLKRKNANQIEPGCEIVVPSKEARRKMSAAEILGLSSTTVSVATMIATMANLFK